MFEIKAKSRDGAIKREALAKTGEIPAVFYGAGSQAVSISIPIIEFKKLEYKIRDYESVIE